MDKKMLILKNKKLGRPCFKTRKIVLKRREAMECEDNLVEKRIVHCIIKILNISPTLIS